MIPVNKRKMTKEDAIIMPSQSQLLGPKMADKCASVAWGLNHMALRPGIELSVLGSSSLVMKASICSCSLEMSEAGVAEIGRMRSSMVRSEEFLNAEIRITFGVLQFMGVLLMNMSSRMIDMNGVMPLPPLTITRVSNLKNQSLINN